MLIFENRISKSFYNSDEGIIRYEFYGRANPDLMIEQLGSMLEYTENRSVFGIFADIKKLQGSFIKIFDWLRDEYYPNLIPRGLTVIAFVVSTDLIAQSLTEKISEMLKEKGVKVKAFKNYEDAIAYFSKQLS